MSNTLKQNKFIKQLAASDSSIKENRASVLSEQVSLEADQLVAQLRREKNQLEIKMQQMTDLSPDENTSLRPGGRDFNAQRWIKELHQLKMQLKLKNIELDEAQSIFDEWFKVS